MASPLLLYIKPGEELSLSHEGLKNICLK